MDQMCMSEITICYGLTEGSPVMTQTRTDDTVERRVKTVGGVCPASKSPSAILKPTRKSPVMPWARCVAVATT